MQSSMTVQLTANVLMIAEWRCGKPMELSHHSGPGSQCASEHLRKLLEKQGIARGMHAAGEIWNNSAMQSFFGSLKAERTMRKVFSTREHARSEVFGGVEEFYNPNRRRSTLDCVSPTAFEQVKEGRSIFTEPAARPNTAQIG